jgi:arylsulfatase A-like enzyme
MGDAFYRWDGFRYYASFSDFLPSVALAYILWSIIAIVIAISLWVLLNLFKWLCNRVGLRTTIEHLLLCISIFIILGLLFWTGKKFILSNIPTSFQSKIIVFIFVSILSIFLTWLFRNNTEKWIKSVNERITPLVWIFSLLIILSLPLVIYHTWFKDTNKKIQVRREASSIKSAANRPNIILVTFDALTAHHMSVYGYHRPTTPFIRQWAQKASIFTKAIAASNYTGPTTASLMTGKRVWTHRRYSHDRAAKPVRSDTENLALLLKENGYHNFAFIQNDVATVESLNISNSFDIAPMVINFMRVATIEGFIEKHLYELFGNKFQIYNWFGQDDFILNVYLRKIPQKVYVTEYPPEEVFNSFLETIDNHPPEPFFAWIHLLPPHDPFLPPEPFSGTFNPSSKLRTKNSQNNFKFKELREYPSKNFPEEIYRKVSLLKDYYDEFILYCDKQFGEFISEIERKPWYKNTIIILSADHGESFEHDYFYHGSFDLYEQVTNIPLIVNIPWQSKKQIIDIPVEQIDIPATILDLANIPVPPWMEGRSLVPIMHGETLTPRPAFSMSLIKNKRDQQITKGTFAVWEGDYKLIYYLDEGKSLLFNLKEDPAELNNLIEQKPETGKHLLALIKEGIKKANGKIVKKD